MIGFEGPVLRRKISDISKLLHEMMFVANHDGNISTKLSDNKRFLCTPTSVSKRLIEPIDLIIVSADGKVLSGRKRLFSEWNIHSACYNANSKIKAVIHSHPPYATAIGLVGKKLENCYMPEPIVSLGKNIPLIERFVDKTDAQLLEISNMIKTDIKTLLISGNGVIAVGDDVEQAFLRMELVEHYAKIICIAQGMGKIEKIKEIDIDMLAEKHARIA